MNAALWTIIKWVFDVVIIKFVVMGVLYIVVYELTPLILEQTTSSINPSGLTTLFIAIPPGVWFFMDFMAIDVGLPLMIVAYVARFLIRRIPLIG